MIRSSNGQDYRFSTCQSGFDSPSDYKWPCGVEVISSHFHCGDPGSFPGWATINCVSKKIYKTKEKLVPTFSEFVNKNLNEELSVEDQLKKLIQGDVESISISNDDDGNTEVNVFIPGEVDLDNDHQWYEITWLPKTGDVISATYKDKKFKHFVTEEQWSKKVKNVKDFAAVINGDAKGEWE